MTVSDDINWRLNFKPWAVQVEALHRSAEHNKYGYFLEQGLGKTAIALNDFVNSDIDLCVVVAPQSFKLGWPTAVRDYGLDLPTGYWPKNPVPMHDHGLYAINYEGVSRSRAKDQLVKLFDDRQVMLVIDESKALGNPRSGWTKSVTELAKRAAIVRELNGTPITQNVMDYYGQLRCLGQLNGWNPVKFRNRFAVLGGYMGKQIMPQVRNQDELAGILAACSFRALKADWRKDLPPKIYTTIPLELTGIQRVHYKEMLDEFMTIVSGTEVTANLILTQMGKLRQISSGIILDGEGIAHPILPPAEVPKIQAVCELIAGPGKTIVSYYHRASGQALFEALKEFEPARIQGGMSDDEVVQEKKRFNEDPSCRVIIGQERAMALGHTLLGQAGNDRCSRTIFYENSFSLYYRLQLEDRNHRGEQDTACDVIDFSCSPIEDTVIAILTAKMELANTMDRVIAAVRGIKA
jgi:SNF2 family DNA or RNA helicase